MKQTSNVGRWWLIGIAAIVAVALVGTSQANVTFSSATSTVHINPTNSKVRIGKASNVTGWGQRSIIRAFGNNASTAWAEAYANGSVVGKNGASGLPAVTKPARTNFVDANSNAIASLGSNATLALIPATSNNLVLTARTYSSSILVLRSRADSSTVLLRAMSNTLLALNPLLRTTSNLINVINNNLAVPTTDSIDGTQFMRYHTGHHVFHNNGNAWTIRGWVRFNNGFTVMPLASVIMDTLTTVSGAIDLRDTGTLILNNDLYLAHNVTLTNGGNIKGQASFSGQANTIFMGGDLTLASTTYARTLHITGDWSNSGTSGNLIIDGCGHTLNIGDRAQIFVDQNVTLTLRNMTIKTGSKSFMNPAIQLASFGSKLALDNVMFDLGTDLRFLQGQLFIHDEVAVTGTSAFIYQSPRPSYITSGATWSFEPGTTFNIAPATYTDRLFTAGTATSNNFIVLADQSSALSFNNCSLKTTFTGARLTKGMVLFDNKVAVDTQVSVDLDSAGGPLTQIGVGVDASTTPLSVAWTPDGRFLAVASSSSDLVRMYRFDNAVGAIQIGSGLPTGASSTPYSVAWSPDGRYLAVALWSTNALSIYRFNGSTLPVLVGSVAFFGGNPFAVSWSPDGRFLAVVGYSSDNLFVYRFDGSGAPVLVGGSVAAIGNPQSVSWSPDGRYLAVGCLGGYLRMYRFSGKSAPVEMGSAPYVGAGFYQVSWSPDGRFLVAGLNNNSFKLYSFDGVSLPGELNSFDLWPLYPVSVAWSPDGRYFAVGLADYLTKDSPYIRIYGFDGGTQVTDIGSMPTDNDPRMVAWSPDGKYLSAVIDSAGWLRVYSCNFIATDPLTQAFTNGLVFGDKAKGSAFDANVQVLSGAVVKVKGKIKDDSV